MSEETQQPRSRRIAGHWQVHVTGVGSDVMGDVSDLSTTGFYFTSSEPMEIGRKLKCEIWTGPEEKILAAVEIVRRRETADAVFGYGSRFVAMTEEDRSRLGESLTAMRRRELAEDFGGDPTALPLRARRFAV